MGHQQTLQNQIRRCRVQRLIRFLTVGCYIVHFKFDTIPTQQPLNPKKSHPIDKGRKFYSV